VEGFVGAGMFQGLDAINVVGRAAIFLGTAIDNAIEVRVPLKASSYLKMKN
jgi:hypothetical protein